MYTLWSDFWDRKVFEGIPYHVFNLLTRTFEQLINHLIISFENMGYLTRDTELLKRLYFPKKWARVIWLIKVGPFDLSPFHHDTENYIHRLD